MEVQEPLQVNILLATEFLLMLLLEGIGFCSPSLVPSEGITKSTCLEKYISESYFEKQEILLDFSFDRYIANELSIDSCGTPLDNHDIKLLVHKRHLIGEGAHRHLLLTIKIDVHHHNLVAEKLFHSLKLVVVERLPNGVFSDPFELQHLLNHGVFTGAAVFGDSNLELPSVASNRSIVEVHIDIDCDFISEQNNGLKIDIELPLHARYPPLAERGFSRVEFGRPDLFVLGCAEEKSDRLSCLLARELGAESAAVVWEVPCGIKGHFRMVSLVTFVSAVIAALCIVLTALYYPHFLIKF